MADKQITLPITGMHCANCSSTIERNLNKLDGVTEANVSYATERATVAFDPSVLGQDAIIGAIQDVGYDVATAKVELPITGMTCANCSATVERTLNKKVPGVVAANVNFATEKITDYESFVAYQDVELCTLAWLYNINRGIIMAAGREEEWTLSIAHNDEDVERWVVAFEDLVRDVMR